MAGGADRREAFRAVAGHGLALRWEEALEAARAAQVLYPGEAPLEDLVNALAERVGRGGEDARRRAAMEAEIRRRQGRAAEGPAPSSRRISDVLHAATTRHIQEDVDALLASARAHLGQGMLDEARRMADSAAAKAPGDPQVAELLREIARRRGA